MLGRPPCLSRWGWRFYGPLELEDNEHFFHSRKLGGEQPPYSSHGRGFPVVVGFSILGQAGILAAVHHSPSVMAPKFPLRHHLSSLRSITFFSLLHRPLVSTPGTFKPATAHTVRLRTSTIHHVGTNRNVGRKVEDMYLSWGLARLSILFSVLCFYSPSPTSVISFE